MGLPPGFVLDKQPNRNIKLPPGFVLDGEPRDNPFDAAMNAPASVETPVTGQFNKVKSAPIESTPVVSKGNPELNYQMSGTSADINPAMETAYTPDTKQAVDAALTVGSMAASPVTMAVAGTAGLLHQDNTDLNSRAERVKKVQDALTYQPRTESGQGVAKALSYPFEKLAEGGTYLGDKTADLTGSPEAGAIVSTAVNMIPFAIPFLKKGYLKGKQAITESEWYREATIPERDLVIQSIDEVAAGLKSQGWTDSQVDAKLARLSPEYFQEQLKKRMATEESAAQTRPVEPAAPETGIPVTEQIQPVKPVAEAIPADVPSAQTETVPSMVTLPEYNPNRTTVLPEGFVLDNPAPVIASTDSGSLNITSDSQISPVTPQATEPIQAPTPQPDIQPEAANRQPDKQNQFERLTPSGKRGAASAFTVNISPSQVDSLRVIRQEVSDGEAGGRGRTNMEQNANGPSEQVSWSSSFPEYFQNKGLTKNQVLPVIDRIINHQPVTEAQWLMAEDLLKAKRYDTLNQILNTRALRRAESEDITAMTEDEKAAAIKAADDFFSQFGGNDEITTEATGSVRTDETGATGRSVEAPVSQDQTGTGTVKIDESGWGQQVAPELQGNKKPVEFGSKKPTGRNVGLSEFTDGFTADPQTNLFSRSSTSHADTGGYNLNPPGAQNEVFGKQKVSALELPEIVEIAKNLMNGQYPHILRKMHKRGALGVFKTGKGSIDLLAEIAKTPGLLERVLAHEVGHLVDWLPDRDINRGNILGRIASLKKYMGSVLEEYEGAPGATLSKKDRARLRREAEKELKANERPEETIIETITREVPQWKYVGITPDMIKDLLGLDAREKYPKLYRAFQEMDTATKKAVLVQAMRGMVHDKVSHFGERVQTGTETVTEQVSRTIPGVSATPEQIAKRYAELVQEEIGKRNLYKKEVITDELKNLTMHWKPFQPGNDPGYTKYRFSSVELYADAFSALINDPALLRKIAPTFEKAFMSYIGRKPEVLKTYYDIQQRLGNKEEVMQNRQENIKGMFEKGEESKKATEDRPLQGILHSLYKDLIDKNADINLRVKQAKDAGQIIEDADNPAYWVETLPYVSGEVYAHLHAIDANILEPMKAEGLTIDNLGEYMMLKRITTDRAELANPLGHTADTATAQLQHMQEQMGPEKFDALVNYVEKYKQIRAENIIDVVDKASLWNEDLMKHVRDNDDYATFEVQKFIEAKYGRGASAHIFKQVGTLQEIRNPFIATVMKDAALIRAANVKIVKQKTTDFLKDHFADEITLADTTWNGKYDEPIEPKNPAQGMIMFPHKGKIEAYYVPKGIAETFDRSPYEASAILKAWQVMNMPLRAIMVNHNPLWMIANVPRDFVATWKNIQGMTFLNLIEYYRKAAPEAYREIFKGEMSQDINSMFKKKMLVTDRQYSTIDESPDNELDRILQQFGKNPVQYRNKVIKPFIKFWELLGDMGKFTERLGKLAGYKYLQDRGATEEKAAHDIRGKVGTPDVYRGGRLKPIYNNLFMFSNVAKEGWRSSWESFKESKAEYAWKTAALNIIPKILMKMAKLGALGAGVKAIMDGVSNYDATNYTVVPIGMDKNKKSVYLRIPQDYTGTLFGGLLWNAMNGKMVGDKSMLSFASEQSPYGLNPYLSAGADIIQIMRGLNPYDDYRGKTVIPDQIFKAHDYRTAIELAKHEWNTLGGSSIYRFSGNGPDKVESELEKMLKMPGPNVLGRFLKVSDQGTREELKEVKEKVSTENARKSLDVKDAIIKDINDHDGKSTVSDKVKIYRKLMDEKKLDFDTKFSEFRPRYERYMSKVANNARIDAVVDAQGNEEKAALLMHYEKTLQPEEYQAIVKQLVIEGHIKRGAIKETVLQKAGVK